MGTQPKEAIQKRIAEALNAHGFLLQQRISEEVKGGFQQENHPWVFEGAEYPVSVQTGEQTRIDLVFSHKKARGYHICIECKRAHPNYRSWVFFGRDPVIRHADRDRYYFERFDRPVTQEGYQNQYQHRITGKLAMDEVSVFTYYLEANLIKKNSQKLSSRDTIETALSQAIYGQNGLGRKLLSFANHSPICVVPVVLTTARLIEADFKSSNVDLDSGTIEANCIQPIERQFVAVNYHASDNLALDPTLVPYPRETISDDLSKWQTRTVFVVHTASIVEFLHKLACPILDIC